MANSAAHPDVLRPRPSIARSGTLMNVPDGSLLNIGCGTRFHPDWVNLDLRPVHSSIERWDASRPLPFADNHISAVYHSHILEHLRKEDALPFVRECHRVLKPGGTLRVAIPDLEAIARIYLESLEEAWADEGSERHRWMVMELFDQVTRELPGGLMVPYLRQLANADSPVWNRIGEEGNAIRRHFNHQHQTENRGPFQARVRKWLSGSWRERLIRWLLGTEYSLLQIGRFRRSGEVHHWMYDRVALRELLIEAGFVDFRCVEPKESAIPNWADYHLDTSPDGAVRKPDSLYVEATKP